MNDVASVGHDADQAVGGARAAQVAAAVMQLAAQLIELRAETLRRAAARGETALDQATTAERDRHVRDARLWRSAMDGRWWERQSERRIAEAWSAAASWAAAGDPEAQRAQEYIAARLARRGVDVTVPGARPDDAKWLRDVGAADAARDGQPAGPRLGHTDADARRLAELARAHWTGSGRAADADAVLGVEGQDPPEAAGAFLYRLHQHEVLAADPDAVRAVLDGIDLDGAYNPPALAEWQTKQVNLAIIEVLEERRAAGVSLIRDRLAALTGPAESGSTPDPARAAEALTAALRDIPGEVNPLPIFAQLAEHPALDQQTREALRELTGPPQPPSPPPPPRRSGRAPDRDRTTGPERAAGKDHHATPDSAAGQRSRRRAAGERQKATKMPPPRLERLVRDAFGDQTAAADAIIGSRRWPDLATTLAMLEGKGHPIDEMILLVRRTGLDAGARHPAALAIFRVREWADGRPESATLGMHAAAQSHPHGPHEAAQAGADAAAAGASPARHRPAATAEPTPLQQTPQRD